MARMAMAFTWRIGDNRYRILINRYQVDERNLRGNDESKIMDGRVITRILNRGCNLWLCANTLIAATRKRSGIRYHVGIRSGGRNSVALGSPRRENERDPEPSIMRRESMASEDPKKKHCVRRGAREGLFGGVTSARRGRRWEDRWCSAKRHA